MRKRSGLIHCGALEVYSSSPHILPFHHIDEEAVMQSMHFVWRFNGENHAHDMQQSSRFFFYLFLFGRMRFINIRFIAIAKHRSDILARFDD